MNFKQWFEDLGNLFLEIKDSFVAFLPKLIIALDFIREVPELTKSSCLFVKDSGHESALA